MFFSPNLLKATMGLLGEPALPCHYFCWISPPPELVQSSTLGAIGGFGVSGYLSLMADSCTLPGKSFSTTNFTMYGTTMKMPYAPLYDDFRASFICSKSMIERTFFDLWMSYVHNPHNNYMNYMDKYASTIYVMKLNNTDLTAIRKLSQAPSIGITEILQLASIYKLENVYPVQIQEQELGYASTDDILRLQINFAYRKYTAGIDVFTKAALPGSTHTPGNIDTYFPLMVKAFVTALTQVQFPGT